MAWWDKAWSAAQAAAKKVADALKKAKEAAAKLAANALAKAKELAKKAAELAKKAAEDLAKKAADAVKKAKEAAAKIVKEKVEDTKKVIDAGKEIADKIVTNLKEKAEEKEKKLEEEREIAAKKEEEKVVKPKLLSMEQIFSLVKRGETAVDNYGLFGAGALAWDNLLTKFLETTGIGDLFPDFMDKKVTVDADAIGKWLFFGGLLSTTISGMKLGEVSLKGITKETAAGFTSKYGVKTMANQLYKWVMGNPVIAKPVFHKFPAEVRNLVAMRLLGTPAGRNVFYVLDVGATMSKSLLNYLFKGASVLIAVTIPIFAVTEIPNYLTMRKFARKNLLQEAGKWPSDIAFKLNSYSEILESYAYGIDREIRDKKTQTTMLKLEEMEKVLADYQRYMEEKKEWMLPEDYDISQDEVRFYSIFISERKKILPESLKEIPEKVKAFVRDIIDGDTIDVSLEAKDLVTKESYTLPEYGSTGHARIRLVGINAPEKTPKGEILCSDCDILNVEKEWADESRDALRIYDDKEVIIKMDPKNISDSYGRILAVLERDGKDINLKQIQEGLACRYFREPHKYVDEELYKKETLKAKKDGVGMWEGLEEVDKEEDKIKIQITSMPTNAKLYLDDVALHHNTPSDEKELSDVIHLFTLGKHVLSAEKAGVSAMENINIVKGDNGKINLTLESAPLPEEEKVVPPEEEVPEEEVPIPEEERPSEEPVKPEEIPETYTSEQEWALHEAFIRIGILIKGAAQMSEEEYKGLVEEFNLYTESQKEVLDLLWRDVWILIKGAAQMSDSEYQDLKVKYHIN